MIGPYSASHALKRLRVLLLAEACNPDWPSLPIVGYKAARALAEVADVTLVTQVRNKPAIETRGELQDVVYIDNEFIARPFYRLSNLVRGDKRVGWTTAMAFSYPAYLAFEYLAWRRFRTDLRAGRFDVVHRLTPMSPTLPSPLAKWSPVPFVLGPLNGGLRWPREFSAERRREREWLSYIRGAYRLLPYWRSTYRHAAVVMGGFGHTCDEVRSVCRGTLLDVAEVGYDPEVFHPPAAPRGPRERLTFLFAGRLVPYKCPDVVVRAFVGSAALLGHKLVIAGDGPERPGMERTVVEAGAIDRVEFVGARQQAEVAELMRAADAFVFPSIRELGAGVVVEAMASGLASIVVDYGGPGGLVDERTGIKLPLGTKEELVTGTRRAMERLAADPAAVVRLGRAAAAEAREKWTWAAKARQCVEIYALFAGAGRN